MASIIRKERDDAARSIQEFTRRALSYKRGKRKGRRIRRLLRRHRNRESANILRRAWLARAAYIRRLRFISARTIQCKIRSRHSIQRFRDIRNRVSAIKVQCAFRNMKSRRELKRRRDELFAYNEVRRKAANVILACARGFLGRAVVADLLMYRENATLEAVTNAIEAAEKFVAACKIARARKAQVAMRDAKEEIRIMLELVEKARRLASALSIQKCYRNKATARAIQNYLERLRKLEIRAAVLVQSVTRGRKARKRFREMTLVYRARMNAATTIQRIFRGRLGRKRANMIRNFDSTMIRVTRALREGWRRRKLWKLRRRVLYRWRRKRRASMRPLLRAWSAWTIETLRLRADKMRNALKMWKFHTERQFLNLWQERTSNLRNLRRAIALWRHRELLGTFTYWRGKAKWIRARRAHRADRACDLLKQAGYRSLLFANRKHPLRRVPYKSWSKRFIKTDQIVKLFWIWNRKKQCFGQLVRNRAMAKKYRRIADAQFLRSCRVYVGWRFHRLNEYRLHRKRKAEALVMGTLVSKRRTMMRFCRYVRYKKWKRMMIRRAIALFSRNALRRYMILWTMWRDRCRGVRERAKQFRLKTLQISFRDWARDIVEEKRALEKKAHLTWAKMQKLRTMRRFGDMMARYETRERWKHWLYRARRHMTKYRKGAVLKAWKDVAFRMKAERLGDDRATKLQAMWRRVDANKRLVKAAKLRRQYYFERQVKSLEKITNIETISELRTLIAKHEWVSSDIFFYYI